MNSGGSPRDRVIDATLRLATRREFGDVTLTDIAQEAGISLADLRELFPSKGAIMGAFSRRIDREVLDAQPKEASHEPARERLYDVLRRRLDALEPHREALASVGRWAARDPLTAAALNRETVNSMRFMLEAADVDSEGPVGSLKLQGLALAWSRVLEDWFAGDIHDALSTLDRELTRGERYVDRAEDFARLTRPFYSFAQSLFGFSGQASNHDQGAFATQRGPFLAGLHRQFKHRLIQPDLTNCKLGGVHADGHTTHPGIQVIAGHRPLTTLIELAPGVQSQQVCRDDGPFAQDRQ